MKNVIDLNPYLSCPDKTPREGHGFDIFMTVLESVVTLGLSAALFFLLAVVLAAML